MSRANPPPEKMVDWGGPSEIAHGRVAEGCEDLVVAASDQRTDWNRVDPQVLLPPLSGLRLYA